MANQPLPARSTDATSDAFAEIALFGSSVRLHGIFGFQTPMPPDAAWTSRRQGNSEIDAYSAP